MRSHVSTDLRDCRVPHSFFAGRPFVSVGIVLCALLGIANFANSLLAAPLGAGTVIGTDFNADDAPLTPTANWNNFFTNSSIGAGSVVDTSGVVVDGMNMSLSNATFFNRTAPSVTPPGFPSSMVEDFSGRSGGGSVNYTINGLDPNLAYNLDVITTATTPSGFAGQVNAVTVSGLGVSQFSAISRHQSHTAGDFHAFTNVRPTPAGTLTVGVSEQVFGNPVVNGARLEATAAAPAAMTVGTTLGVDINADEIRPDIHRTTPTTHWNNFTTNGAMPDGTVVNTAGNILEGVSVTLSGSTFFNRTATSATPPGTPTTVIDDFGGTGGGGAVELTISGLDPNLIFDLDVFTTADTAGANQRINRVAVDSLDDPATSLLDRFVSHTTGEFHSFSEIRANPDGTLTLTIDETVGGNPVFNGLRLTAVSAVPEPATLTVWLMLAAAVSAVILGTRRRIKK